MKTSLSDFLESEGVHSDIPPKDRFYDALIGRWKITSTWVQAGTESKAEGEWHFWRVLGGWGVQDVLFADGWAPAQYGTTLRCYDSRSQTWNLTWMQPGGREFAQLTARKSGDEVIQEVQGGEPRRWVFRTITAAEFLWVDERLDTQENWVTEQTIRGTRMS